MRLIAVVAVTVTVQLAIHHLPMMQRLFGIGPISLADCALSHALGFIPVTAVELVKVMRRGARPAGSAGAPRGLGTEHQQESMT